jgi:hypothetical protein
MNMHLHSNKSIFVLSICLAYASIDAESKKSKPKSTAITERTLELPSRISEEISLNKNLVVEGKAEKPQVQFPLVKEAPPEKRIQFETSFLSNILYLERENTLND